MLDRKIAYLQQNVFKEKCVKEVMDSTWTPNVLEEESCNSAFDSIIQNVVDVLVTNTEK